MPKRRVGVEYSLSTLEPVRLEAVSPERALYLPTFSHLVIVNTAPLSLSLSLSLLNLCTPIRHFHCPLQTTVAEYKLLLVPLQLEGRAAGASRWCNHFTISSRASGPTATHRCSWDPLKPLLPILACSGTLLGRLSNSCIAVSMTSTSRVSSPGMILHLAVRSPITRTSSSLCCTAI